MSAVVATRHVAERLVERYSELDASASAVARCEVAAAIREGRVAKAKPRPLAGEGRRERTEFSYRFAWTPGFGRLYVIHKGSRATRVITVLEPVAEEAEQPRAFRPADE